MKGVRATLSAINAKQAARYIGRKFLKYANQDVIGNEVTVDYIIQNLPNSILLTNIRRWIEEGIITVDTPVKIGCVKRKGSKKSENQTTQE